MTSGPDLLRPATIRVALTGAGKAAAAAAVLALLFGWADAGLAFSVVAALLGGVLVAAAFSALRAAHTLRVEPPDRVVAFAGEPSVFAVRVANVARRGAAYDVTLRLLERGAGRVRAAGFLPQVRAGETGAADVVMQALRRGRHDQGALTAESSFPLGLVRATLRFELSRDVVALPRPGALRVALDDPVRARGEAVHGATRRGDEQEIRGLRPWREGESLRPVHWKLSARRGRLVSREYGGEPVPRVHVVLATAVETRSPGLVAAFEDAVTLTATIVDHFLRRGHAVRMTIASSAPRTDDCAAGRGGLVAALCTLAEVQPEPSSSAPVSVRRFVRPGERVFVVRSGGDAGDDALPRGGASVRILDVGTAPGGRLFERVARTTDDLAVGVRR